MSAKARANHERSTREPATKPRGTGEDEQNTSKRISTMNGTMDHTNSERTASVATIPLVAHDVEVQQHVRRERWLSALLALAVVAAVAAAVA